MPKRSPPSISTDQNDGVVPPARIVMFAATALVIARYLVPTESVLAGDTLWIAGLWFLPAAGWAMWCGRTGRRPQFDLLDLAFLMVLLGHWLSGIAVLFDGGNKRAALNLVCEWTSLGVSWLVIRHGCGDPATAARPLLRSVLLLFVVLSGYGLWQHYVDFPRLRANYDAQVALADAGSVGSQAARQSLTGQGVPESGPARLLFEQRLRASTEPFGPFALANTLAGFLAVTVVIGVGQVVAPGARSLWLRLGVAVAMLPVAYCLLLTKSRTAAVGALFGLGLVALRVWPGVSDRRSRWAVGISVLLVAVGVGTGIATGGLDLEVLSEAPKSLSYRTEYWRGTARVLADRPVLGTGPGNFRQHYLSHKLAESSEEVLDPHNFLLDAWANGGAAAGVGIVALLALVGVTVWRRGQASAPTDSDSGGPVPTLASALTGFVLVFATQWLRGEERPLLTGILASSYATLWMLGPSVLPGSGTPSWLAGPAALTLFVHLLAAGGMEMPAVLQLLILLTAVAVPCRAPRVGVESPMPLAVAAGILILGVGCWWSAVLPVSRARFHLNRAQAAQLDGSPGAAADAYRDAAAADPFSPAGLRHAGRMEMALWVRSPQTHSEAFGRAVDAWAAAQDRDPYGYVDARSLGVAWLRRARQTGAAEDASQAVQHLAAARDRYPTHAQLRAELALAHRHAGQAGAAATEAARALELDQINRSRGHQDRFLDEPTLQALREL